jgi:hypothetical protein
MNTPSTLCLPLLALSLVAGTATTAAAQDEGDPAPSPPADTGGKYVPVSDDYYAEVEFPACGTRITVTSGDVQDAYEKVRVKRDGRTVIKIRGNQTVDVSAEPDGALPDGGFIDELDVSGPGSTRISADGMTIVQVLEGPSIVYPVSETDSAALNEAGLSDFFVFNEGKLKVEIVFSDEEGALEPESVEVLKNTTRDRVDLCEALAWSAVK